MNYNNRKVKNSSEDDDDLGAMNSFSNNTPRMFRKTYMVNSFDYYMDEDIGAVDEYRDLIHSLHTGSETDSFRIWVDTDGGQLNTALAIIDAMGNTDANVTVIVHGRAYSAGSLIALAGMDCGQLVVGKRARFMLHSGNFGSAGKESEVEEHTKDVLKRIRELKREFYTGFLTGEEMNRLDIGKDYYFDSKEVHKRVKQRLAYLEEKQKPKPRKTKAVAKPEYDPEDVAFAKTIITGGDADTFIQELTKAKRKP